MRGLGEEGIKGWMFETLYLFDDLDAAVVGLRVD